ncbi:MerR family transcriptional regulator [Chitinimonas sp.]|uniref:MerR family transcriptional regulator n=1 Tax=Chitinimonas sp. TaxID=1934313 RepID=UPI002F9457FB
MLLKIGELAKRTGLSVRALRHYDEIGLLPPSARTDAGYRLYNQHDVARLYRLLALRQIGLSLADIGPLLTGDGMALPVLIERQMQLLDSRIAEATALRDKLGQLHSTLAQQRDPAPDEWLSTMERMTMYDKYFSQAEQAELKQRAQNEDVQGAEAEWPQLIAAVRAHMQQGTAPDAVEVQALAQRWRALVQQFVGSNPALLPKLHTMYQQEAKLQADTGIDPAMLAYIGQAMAQSRLAIYARYLDEDEMVRLRANYGRNMQAWPALVANVRRLMQAGTPPEQTEARALAREWYELTAQFAGHDPRTREKLRQAMEQEPALLEGSGIDLAMLDYLRRSHAAATQADSTR